MKKFLILLTPLVGSLPLLYSTCDNYCTSNTRCSKDDHYGCHCRSIFLPRSQGDNLRRQATYKNYEFDENNLHCCNNWWDNASCEHECGSFYGNVSVEYRYQQSIHCNNIARNLFGRSELHFQGSNIITSAIGDSHALLADNFGLSPNVDNIITFCPLIKNNILDIELYLGLNEYLEGLFIQFNMPIVNTNWSLGAHTSALNVPTSPCSCNQRCNSCCTGCGDNNCGECPLPAPDTTPFNPGCMGNIAGAPFTGPNSGTFPILPTENTASAPSYECALSGDFLFGDMQTKWKYNRFKFPEQEDNRLASFNVIIGYNFYECTDYHVGIFFRTEAPAGTKLDCCWAYNLFTPICGINHWGVGGGITGHAELFNCDDEHMINFFFEGYVQHFVTRSQARSFDFKDKGCLSRYMLLKEFNADLTYNGSLINGINYATRHVKTSIDVAGEGIIEFVYSNECGLAAGIGYNVYGNSREKASCIGTPCDVTICDLVLGFKGCTPIDALDITITTNGAGATTVENPVVVNIVALNSTANDAIIHSCGNVDSPLLLNNALPQDSNSASLNINPCSPNIASITGGQTVNGYNATTGTVAIGGTTYSLAGTSGANATYNTATGQLTASTPEPVTFLGSDTYPLDIESGLAGNQITHKIFGHIDYIWNCHDWNPHLYIGAEGEFANSEYCDAMSAWAIFVGFMVGF